MGRDYGTTFAVAAVVFLVSYDGGGFAEQSRDTFAVGLWWVLILAVGLGLWPLVRLTRAAVVTGGLLAAFALLTLLSTTWAASAEGAYAEFTRVGLFLAVFAVAVVGSSRANAGRWCDGLALGISAVAVLALVSRLFPYLTSAGDISRFLSGAQTRLSYPLGYWNGLGILTAIAIPLLLRVAVSARTALARGLALAPVPVIAGVIYLTSSRGAVAVAVVGSVVFFACTAQRWATAAAALVAGVGSVLVVWTLVDRDRLVNGPLRTAATESQGRSAALIIGGICLLVGLGYGLGCRFAPRVRFSPALGWGLVLVAVLAAVVGIAASHPVGRLEAFKRVQTGTQGISNHLTSKSGNGRWQLWTAGIKEFEHKPVLGTGAGSYQEWWLQHGTLKDPVEDAHSLYVETLGELGIVGFLLVVGGFVAGLAVAIRRLVRTRGDDRVTLAALTAAFAGYAVGAGFDWMWEMTIVTVIGFVCLALMTGGATAVAAPRPAAPDERAPRSKFGLGIVALVVAWLVLCATAIPLLAGVKLRASQSDAARGDLPAALKDATQARDVEPWAFSPYEQAALVQEQAGNFPAARSWVEKAIDRDRDNWQLWLLAARIQVKLGAVADAKRSLARAKALNPRSCIWKPRGCEPSGPSKPSSPSGLALPRGKAEKTVRGTGRARVRVVFYDVAGHPDPQAIGATPPPGERFVAVKLGFENRGAKPVDTSAAVSIMDDRGGTHDPVSGPGLQPVLGRATIAPHVGIVGYTTFVIPASAKVRTVDVGPLGASGATAEFSVS